MKLNACLLLVCVLLVSHNVSAQNAFQSKNCKFYVASINFEHSHPNRSSFDRVDWNNLSNFNFIPSTRLFDINQIHWSAMQQFDLSDWIKKNKSLVKKTSHGFITCPMSAQTVSWDERSARYQIDHYQLHSSGPEIKYTYNKKIKKSSPSKVNYSCVYLSPLLLAEFNRTLGQKKIECSVELIPAKIDSSLSPAQ